MDLLEQYQKQYPKAFREKPKWQPSSEYGFFIRLVMRFSGGRIREVRQASRVLLATVGIIIFAALIMIFWVLRDTRPTPSAADFRLTPPSAQVR